MFETEKKNEKNPIAVNREQYYNRSRAGGRQRHIKDFASTMGGRGICIYTEVTGSDPLTPPLQSVLNYNNLLLHQEYKLRYSKIHPLIIFKLFLRNLP